MEKLDPKADGATPDIGEQNIEKMKVLFPDVFTEGKVDLDALRETLGDYADERQERYSFTWNGKARARRIAHTPSTGTLRPCPDESVNWDTTQNLFIEGDNLEVLKLLQKSYHKKVKMIYIDPPYNTGNEFIYPDKFQDNLDTYLRYTGQVDGEGLKFTTNVETSGRYHTNWLNMMFPRLKLARNLLDDDGVICVSISDIELGNLRSLLNEVFGEENYINTVSILAKVAAGASGGGEDKRLKKNIEYILIYAKRLEEFNTLTHLYTERPLMDVIDEMRAEGESWKYTSILLNANEREHFITISDGEGNPIEVYKRRGVERTTINRVCKEEKIDEATAYKKYFSKLFSDTNAQSSIRARVIEAVGNLNDNEILEVEYVPRSGRDKNKKVTHTYISNTVRRVIWLSEVAETDEQNIVKKEKLGTLWTNFDYNNVGKEGEIPFPDGKKPIDLIRTCIRLYDGRDGSFLDFFAGSGSLAHASMCENAVDQGTRRFIVIQLPEIIAEENKKYQAAMKHYKDNQIPLNVSEIGKERIRRVIKRMESERQEKTKEAQASLLKDDEDTPEIDLGFKVFKLDASNIKPWDADFDNFETALLDYIENIKPDRSEADVLYELLLKYGLDLAVPIEERNIAGKTVYLIGAGALVVCLDKKISLEVVEGIAALKGELKPEVMRVVFKDSGFADDLVKTNAVQILRQAEIEDVKSL
jgi:adenine-specific DNA-methyltransferase